MSKLGTNIKPINSNSFYKIRRLTNMHRLSLSHHLYHPHNHHIHTHLPLPLHLQSLLSNHPYRLRRINLRYIFRKPPLFVLRFSPCRCTSPSKIVYRQKSLRLLMPHKLICPTQLFLQFSSRNVWLYVFRRPPKERLNIPHLVVYFCCLNRA